MYFSHRNKKNRSLEKILKVPATITIKVLEITKIVITTGLGRNIYELHLVGKTQVFWHKDRCYYCFLQFLENKI